METFAKRACSIKGVIQVGIETSYIKLPIPFALEYRVFCVRIFALFGSLREVSLVDNL